MLRFREGCGVGILVSYFFTTEDTEDTEEQSSENFVPDAEKDETDVKGENSFRKIKICLSKIKSFLEEEDDEEDDEEDSDEDEEASNECEVIPFKSKEDSDEK